MLNGSVSVFQMTHSRRCTILCENRRVTPSHMMAQKKSRQMADQSLGSIAHAYLCRLVR